MTVRDTYIFDTVAENDFKNPTAVSVSGAVVSPPKKRLTVSGAVVSVCIL